MRSTSTVGGISILRPLNSRKRHITLDGCCDHTKTIGSEEIHEYFTHLMRDVDLLVFGRKTHQLMVPFWPDVAKNHSQTKAMNEFAQTFDSINRTEGEALFGVWEGRTRSPPPSPRQRSPWRRAKAFSVVV
jgi:hypothetical protein